MKYSIDTCSILQGFGLGPYPINRFKVLWDNIDSLINNGNLRAVKEVYYELEKKEDKATEWAKKRQNLFIEIDDQIQTETRKIIRRYPGLVDPDKEYPQADCFVISLAKINNATVVTQETFSNNLDKPKIPNICRELRIDKINFLELINRENWFF